MILKTIVLVGLLAGAASGSAIKGRETYPAKGQHLEAPAEQAKLAEPELGQQREEKQPYYEAQSQLAEQTRYDDYQQQREEQVKQAAKLPEQAPAKQQYYEAKPQVREDVVAAAAPAPVVVARASAKGEPAYAAKTEERREEQAQYQVQAEQVKLEEVQRAEEVKQEPLQQAVELTKQDYEQRRFEEQTEQRADEQVAQVREEGQVKGGLRPAGAEAEPYAFDYSVEGSSRRETGDQHGVVRGQYTIQGADGSQRIVDYIADSNGFRAQVQTNEFGTESQQPANVALRSSQPSAEGISLRLEGKTRELTPVQQVQVAAPAVKAAPLLTEVVRARPYDEAYKGAPAKGAEPQYAVKAPALVQAPAPYKGQEAAQVVYQRAPEPVKSAELRAAPVVPLRASPVIARASGFESATAHRPVVHSHVAPAVRHLPAQPVLVQPPVVRHQLLAPVRSHQQQLVHRHHHHAQPVFGVSRSQLQYDRYPVVPYRREPLNPRVSFYSSGHDDSIGFEHPADLV